MKVRILHIEDNPADAVLFERLLKKIDSTDFELTQVDTLKSAIGAVEAIHFDVIVIDLGLPDADGFEAPNKIHELDAKSAIIVVTGEQDFKFGRQLLKVGAQDFLTKDELNPYTLSKSILFAKERNEMKNELEKQRDELLRFSLAIEQSTNSIIITNHFGIIQYVNQHFENLSGFNKAEVVGENAMALSFFINANNLLDEIRGTVKGGGVWTGVLEAKNKNGSIQWLKSKITGVRNEDDEIIYYLFSSEDITEQRNQEERLRSYRVKLETSQRIADFGHWDYNFGSKVYTWSQQVFQILELPEESQVLPMNEYLAIVHKEDRGAVKKYFGEIKMESESASVQYRVVLPSGKVKYLEDSWEVFKDDDGKSTHVLGVVHDITSVQETQLQLKATVGRLKEAQEIARFGAWVWVLGEEESFVWSEELFNLLELDPTEVRPHKDRWASLIHEDDKERVLSEFDSTIQSLEHLANIEYRIVLNSGRLMYVEDNLRIKRDASGKALQLNGVMHDITKRKKVELEKFETAEKLSSIVSSLDDHLFVVDESGRFKEFYTGTDVDSLVSQPRGFLGKKIEDVIPEIASQFRDAFKEVKEGNKHKSFDYAIKVKGETSWHNAKLSPLKDLNDAFTGVTVIVRNITEAKRNELALAESEEKFRFQSEFLPHILWTADASGRTTYVNKKGRDFYGDSLALFEEGKWDGLHPEDRAKSEALWNESLRTKSSFNNLERHKHRAGYYKWLNITATPVLTQKGKISSWIGVSTDVDDEMKAKIENESLLSKVNARVKEAACLYKIAHITQQDIDSIDELLEEVVKIIPSGFKYDTETFVRLTYRGKVFENQPHSFRRSIAMELKMNNQTVGELAVSSPKTSSKGDLITFSQIEVNMLRTIQENITLLIQNFESTKLIVENEKRLSAIFDNAVVGIGLLKDNRFVECNATMLDIFESDRDEFIGKVPWLISPAKQQTGQSSEAHFKILIEDLQKKDALHFNWRFETLKGNVLEADVHMSLVKIKEESVAMVFVRDITDEIAAQEALKASEAEYRNIFENMQEGYLLRDIDGEILSINPAGLKILEFESYEDVVGRNLQEFIADKGEVKRSKKTLLKHKVVNNALLLIKTENGNSKIIELNKRLITNGGNSVHVESTFRDVTNSKQMQDYMESSIKLYEDAGKGYLNLYKVGLAEAARITRSELGFFYLLDGTIGKPSVYLYDKDFNELREFSKSSLIERDSKLKKLPDQFMQPLIDNKPYDVEFFGKYVLSEDKQQLIRRIQVPVYEGGELKAIFGLGNKRSNYTRLDLELVINFVNLFYSLISKKNIQDEHQSTLDLLEQSQKVGKIGAWRYALKQDRTWWSEVMYSLFGISEEIKLTTELQMERIHEDDRELVGSAFKQALITGVYDQEYRIITPAGELKYIYSKGRLIENEGAQGPVILGIAQDITEAKVAQKLIEEKSQQFQNIVESLPGVVYRLKFPSMRLEFISDFFEEMLGWSKQEILRNSSTEYLQRIIHPDDFELVRNALFKIVEESDNYSLSMRFITRSGDVRWTLNKGKVVITEEGGVVLEGFLYDVTERVKAEERILNAMMEASDSEKKRISKEIHDSLQQTLTIASLNLEFVKRERDVLTERAQNKLDIGWEYLKRSLNDSRGIAHKLMPKGIEDFGLVPVLQDMTEELSEVGDINFEFITNMENKRLLVSIETNLYKLVQEATNNIFKHAKAKQVVIQYINSGEIVQLTIEDDGVGFDDRDYKASSLGFGMASMKNRASTISASFHIDSQPGYGTTILVELPFTQDILMK